MLNKPKPRRFPLLVLHNHTTVIYRECKFIGGPVRILQTIMKWHGQILEGTWFAN
jgi:hypothetical protein